MTVAMIAATKVGRKVNPRHNCAVGRGIGERRIGLILSPIPNRRETGWCTARKDFWWVSLEREKQRTEKMRSFLVICEGCFNFGCLAVVAIFRA